MKRTMTNRWNAKPSVPSPRMKKLPDHWDLTHLLTQPVTQFDHLIKKLDSQVSKFESLRGGLDSTMSSQVFVNILKLNETIAQDSARLSAYAYLWFSENTKNLEARAFKTKVEERLTAFQNRMLFFELWWQSVDESNAARLMKFSGDVLYFLESIRRYKPHTLSEAEEKVINVKNTTGRHALNTIYDVLTNGLTFSLIVKGRKKALTREQLSMYVRSPDANMRESAYREMYRVFESHHDVLGELYTTLLNDWRTENVDLRRFTSPIAARNLSNDIPDEAVDALLNTCAKNASIFQDYFQLKARLCKIKPMSRYHIYAPHRTERTRYRYADAVRMVLDAYRGFSPLMADHAETVLQEQHVDGRTVTGKLSGAYCYSVLPGFTPYVLLNYTGEARDVATLAHELGHAVHSMMAADHSIFTFHSTLPLAETASVFGERLLSEALMAQESNQTVKQGLLLAQLDDIYATVIRQAYFILFEKTAHRMTAEGGTVKDLANAYLLNLRQQFGKAVKVPDEFRWEWLTIPHIFSSPFYCYAYSFGNLLVLALYRRYKQQGPSFIPNYLNLLAAGGSQSPDTILTNVGVDMRSEAFWQSGFDTIRDMVVELERTQN